MARNRKREDVALQWGTLIRAFVASAVIAGLGIGYVRQTILQDRLGQEQLRLEKDLKDLATWIAQADADLAALTTTSALRDKMQTHRLGLTNTPPARRIFLFAPASTNRSASVAGSLRDVRRSASGSALATLNSPTRP